MLLWSEILDTLQMALKIADFVVESGGPTWIASELISLVASIIGTKATGFCQAIP